MTVATIAGVRFRTPTPLFETDDSGFADVDVDVDWVVPGPDVLGAALSGPDETWMWVDVQHHRVHLPQGDTRTAGRSWQLRQAAPIVAAAFGNLTLHAGASQLGHCAIAIVGETGAGKSTLVWELTKSGAPALADDLVPVRFRPEVVIPEPSGDVRLGMVAFLSRTGDSLLARSLDGKAALERHIENGFGEHGDPEIWQAQFDAYHRIVGTIPHFDLVIPDDRTRLPEVADWVRELMARETT